MILNRQAFLDSAGCFWLAGALLFSGCGGSPPRAVQAVSQSPELLNMSTGDTKQITVTVNPNTASVTTGFTTTLNSNPDSSCAASLTLRSQTGRGSLPHPVTASPAGCSGVFTAQASADGVRSSNTTTVRVPPQILVQMINGEAGGQEAPGDTSQLAVGVAARNRFNDAGFFPGATNYQNTITPDQFLGLTIPPGQITHGPEPELSHAVGVFTREVDDFISPAGGPKSQCFFSPTVTEWEQIQPALQSGTTDPTGIPNPTGCYSQTMNGAQIRVISSVANNADGRAAPAFVFQGLRVSSTAPVVIGLP